MYLRKDISFFTTIFVFIIFIFFAYAQESQAATLTLSPSSGTYDVGNTIVVSVILNTQSASVAGVDINALNFDPARLSVVDSNGGQSGVQISPGSLMSTTVLNTVNNTTGTIQFSQVSIGGSTYNGSGTLATITFLVLSPGTAGVTFDFSLGDPTDTNVASGGLDVLNSVTNASFIINQPASTKFSINDFVRTTSTLNVRSTANGTLLGAQTPGSLGTVIGGPQFAGGFWWWQINYVNAPDGWSAENNLETTSNTPPSVNAGSDQTITLPSSATLSGSASDDGLPNVGGSNVSTTWSLSSGPASVSFSNTSSLNGQVTFSVPGSYTLRLTADDGNLSASDFVGITVNVESLSNMYFFPNLEGRSDVSGSSFTISIFQPAGSTAVQTFTQTADGSERVLMPSNTLPDGSYDVRVSSPSYLRKRINLISLSSDSNVSLSSLSAGDLNGDNVIDSLDWSIMNPVWFMTSSGADINQDGIVNSIDFSFLSVNWFDIGD